MEPACDPNQFAHFIEADRARLITTCDQEKYRSDQLFGVTRPSAS
jgi:hypothetical protein